ncbi:MAG: hypothetical protein COB54_00015 [Alphaproteobacteria bacterium]|nr:MAG: hypothetical protein COB54_00015 [Alphaproteobacteria bacterium]
MTKNKFETNAPPLPLDVDNSLLFKMVRMTNHMSQNYEHSPAREQGLSVKDWRIVLIIASHHGTSAAAMSKFSGYDQMSVGRTVRKLERLSWIYLKANPSDHREIFLFLTEDGEKSYRDLAQRINEYEQEILSVFTPSQQKTLDKLLTILSEKVTDYNKK